MKEYKEIALIAVVMTDATLEPLYKSLRSFINASDMISGWAVEFHQKHSQIEDWDLFANMEGYVCWDDYVAGYAMKKLQEIRA